MTEPSGILVTMRHMRQARHCASGVRRWFEQYDRAQLATFCRQGLPVEWFEAQGDALGLHVAALARAEAVARG